MLNALRHHSYQQLSTKKIQGLIGQCSTPYGITAINSRIAQKKHRKRHIVLNALRHHSYQQFAASAIVRPVKKCSTPYGITAINSTRCCRSRASLAVLNALRHHSYQQHKPIQLSAKTTEVLNALRHHSYQQLEVIAGFWAKLPCSTPYGITAINSQIAHVELRRIAECSTPYGITAINSVRAPNTPQMRNVLNALRHHSYQQKISGRRCGGH